MMELFETRDFEGIDCRFYRNSKGEVFLNHRDLALCLGYVNATAINSILSRNFERFVYSYLSDSDENGSETIFLSEYASSEVSLLSKSSKTNEFRLWLRKKFDAMDDLRVEPKGNCTIKDTIQHLEEKRKELNELRDVVFSRLHDGNFKDSLEDTQKLVDLQGYIEELENLDVFVGEKFNIKGGE